MARDDLQYGAGRTPGDHVQEILHREAAAGQKIADHLLRHDYKYLGSEDIPADRYYSYDFHRREVEGMWRKVWQIVCRVEDIPEVGDHYLYELAEHSIIVVRSAPDSIKAFHNSCLHRGTTLRAGQTGTGPTLRCPFHGWTWNLDGTLKTIPSKWDFEHVTRDPKKSCLPECKVDTWGGFVFINMDENAEPLREYLEVIPEHFEAAGWRLENAVKVAHVATIVDSNWKGAIESVLESYHGPCTHPQLTSFYSGEESQYDVYGPHTDRHVALYALPHPQLRAMMGEQDIADAMAASLGWQGLNVTVPEGSTAREALADMSRKMIGEVTGMDLSEMPTVSTIDNVAYSLFPATLIGGGFAYPVLAMSRPYGDDPNRCIIEVYLLGYVDPSKPRPEPAKIHWINADDWTEAPELGVMGLIFNQDIANLARMQRGLRASQKRAISLGDYMEVRIRKLHQTIDQYLAAAEGSK